MGKKKKKKKLGKVYRKQNKGIENLLQRLKSMGIDVPGNAARIGGGEACVNVKLNQN